jgi:hypothetical protein
MAVADEETRHVVGGPSGEVQVGSDPKSWPALKDEVFNGVALTSEPTGDMDFDILPWRG